MYYMIFDEIYDIDGNYYYIKLGSMLPIESGTVCNMNNGNLNNYKADGYKSYDIGSMKVLTKRVVKCNFKH